MKKIVLLPLDERPCNVKFPMTLFNSGNMHIVRPEKLGEHKQAASHRDIDFFLQKECKDAYGLVLSLEMLLYGGLVPSRLHSISLVELRERLELLRTIKIKNPTLKIFAFHCIMRCPQYSSSMEEPEYYAKYGAQIHSMGVALHRLQNGELCEELQAEKERLEQEIPPADLLDYTSRRSVNLQMNLSTLSLLQENVIDFLIIPQDDAAPLGFTAMDQAKVRLAVRENALQHKALIYPGADELAMTLLARMRNELERKSPRIFVRYASIGAPFVIPRYEDRPLDETLSYQIMAAGCRRVYSEEQSDLIFAVTAPPNELLEASLQPSINQNYAVNRSLPPFMQSISDDIKSGKPVAVCDNAYCNGGDLEVLSMLDSYNILTKVAAYAGWNTSANTAGTAIAQGVRYLYEGSDKAHLAFLMLRYVEDCGYDALVRQDVINEDLQSLGLNYRDIKERDGEVAACVKKRLKAFVSHYMPSVATRILIAHVQMPWKRMFEADIDVSFL